MELKDLADLVAIRQYVRNSIEFHTIDKSTVSELNGILIMLDKKIIEILRSSDFKKFIDYKSVDKVIQEAANISNIKSGLHKK
jgi:hypothetical protein